MNDINWDEVQTFYNDNRVWRDVLKHFNISNAKLCKAVKHGVFITRSKSDANKLSHKLKPRTHSTETKKLISEARKEYLKNNPDKVPYLLNHYSKGDSYPEVYFECIFKKHKINYIKKYRIHTYELDFAILDKKIDIEIDGSQHILDKRIVESDIKRTKYLEDNGWDIIRIDWSKYQKSEKDVFIKELIDYINNIILTKPTLIPKEQIKNNFVLCKCGELKYRNAKQCKECYRISTRKVERPPYEQLLKEISESNYSAVGRKYGVSDKTIRKWIKVYNKFGL